MWIVNSLTVAALLLRLASAATLTGRIVEDHSGSPTPSASVRMYKVGVRGLTADLETDSEGRFHASELPEGEYRIEISKPNHVAARLRIQLTAGDASPLMVRLIRCGVITGHVTDSHGQPIRGAQVLAMAKPATGRPLRPEFTPGRFAAVDERGRYRLFNLPPGQYFIALSYGASTFAVGSTGSAATSPNLGSGVLFYPTSANPQSFSVTGGEEFGNIDFAVFPSSFHSVSGKVEFPPAQDGRGRFWLALAAVDQPGLAAVVTQAETGGGFRFNSVPTGSYHLFVSGPTSARGSRGASLNPDAAFARTRVDVSGHDVNNVAIAPEKGHTVTFALRPSDARCSPAAELVLAPLEDWAAQLERRTPITLSKEQTVSGLAPARYVASISGLGETCHAPDTVIDLSTPNSGPFSIPVHSAGAIHGRLDPGDRRSADFAIVLFSDLVDPTRPVQVAFPDAQSRFTFSALTPGRYRIAAQTVAASSRWLASGARSVEIDVPGGAPVEITLSALPAGTSQP